MTSISVPEPVMSLAVAPKARDQSANFSKALNRFTKEDPTFKVRPPPPQQRGGDECVGFARAAADEQQQGLSAWCGQAG
jgi:hypothetical protein